MPSAAAGTAPKPGHGAFQTPSSFCGPHNLWQERCCTCSQASSLLISLPPNKSLMGKAGQVLVRKSSLERFCNWVIVGSRTKGPSFLPRQLDWGAVRSHGTQKGIRACVDLRMGRKGQLGSQGAESLGSCCSALLRAERVQDPSSFISVWPALAGSQDAICPNLHSTTWHHGMSLASQLESLQTSLEAREGSFIFLKSSKDARKQEFCGCGIRPPPR